MAIKLRGRVLLLVLAVVLAAVALSSVVLNTLLVRGFARYLHTGQRERMTATVETLADYYKKHQTWYGLTNEVFIPSNLVAVEDTDGEPIAVRRMGRGMLYNLNAERLDRMPIEVDGRLVGQAVFLAPPGVWGATVAERDLRWAINRAIFLGGISAAAIAVLLGLTFAKQLARPLSHIEQTARAIAAGDLKRRAKVEGDDEVAVLARTLNDLAARIEKLLEERRRLSADLAHELRTPLAVIRSLTESFADGVLPADQEHLDQVKEEIERIQTLIERIQEAFLPEQAAMERTPVDLNDLAGGLVARFLPRYKDKGVELSLETAPAAIVVSASREQLEMALGNLLDNALKYSPSGSPVMMTVESGEGRARLTVADRGIGIAPEHLPHVFDRLFRADPSRSRGTGGYGLGLAIAKEIAQAHGGNLEVESKIGQGSVFRLELPRV